MHFIPFPFMTFVRPSYTQPIMMGNCPNVLIAMKTALCSDFLKYVQKVTLNELSQTQRDDKKSENAQTMISNSCLQESNEQKFKKKVDQIKDRNGKSSVFFENKAKDNEIVETCKQKKRACFQRARFQITQALEQSKEEIEQEEKEFNEQKEEIDSIKQKSREIEIKIVNKIKRIKKSRKIVKKQEAQLPPQKLNIEAQQTYISTNVSLINTIDHPRIQIDRQEIQRKKQNLLSRSIVYDQFEQKKYNYQIRQRRELKKLF